MFACSPQEMALLVINQRKKLKLSQAAVANLVGLKQSTVSAFENKPESTKLATLFSILAAVNLELQLLSKTKPSTDETIWQEEW